ncbi:galectin 17 [Pempheris klunzingeri]|uniref:galectin 17 n=1 Tax=Pempheris klunzingeri TaxID=3127111 RepID=UPI003980439B
MRQEIKSHSFRTLLLLQLHCLLLVHLVESSAHLQIVTSKVGSRAVLPCSWKLRLEEAPPSPCHVQWRSPADTVFELWGTQKWQSEEFDGRAEIPEDKLESGDCSLIIKDAQIVDAGRYESFMVVNGVRSTKTRVFIQSVKLSVLDHKSLQTHRPGENLVLDLYTVHSERVVFQGRNSSEWSDLWKKGDKDCHRMEKNPLRDQLTIKKLERSDEGTYKVLDQHGLAVSTVQLSVDESSPPPKSHQIQEIQPLADDAAKNVCSALLLPVLVTTLQILHHS